MRQENVTCKVKIKILPISLRWQHAVDGCGENEILEVAQGDEILEGACWSYRDSVSLLGQNKTQCQTLRSLSGCFQPALMLFYQRWVMLSRK
jgi:hypothetical protein